ILLPAASASRVLFVSVSVVARPTRVSVEDGIVTVAAPAAALSEFPFILMTFPPAVSRVLLVRVSVVVRPTSVSVIVGRESVPPLFNATSFSVPLASAALPLPMARVPAAVREMPISGATVGSVADPLNPSTASLLPTNFEVLAISENLFAAALLKITPPLVVISWLNPNCSVLLEVPVSPTRSAVLPALRQAIDVLFVSRTAPVNAGTAPATKALVAVTVPFEFNCAAVNPVLVIVAPVVQLAMSAFAVPAGAKSKWMLAVVGLACILLAALVAPDNFHVLTAVE